MSAQLVFRIEDQHYALPVDTIMEVIPLIAVSCPPQMPADWYGIANIRGIVTPIIDLRAHFRLPAITPSLSAPLIVLRESNRQLALLVDEIVQILHQSAGASVELHDGRLVVVLEPRTLFDKTPDIAERRN
jgi:chemotaxis signal transduction protein